MCIDLSSDLLVLNVPHCAHSAQTRDEDVLGGLTAPVEGGDCSIIDEALAKRLSRQ